MRTRKPYKDLTGLKVGTLEVVGFAFFDKAGKSKWKVKCSCGAEKAMRGNNLLSGLSRNCGCTRMETIRKKLYRGIGDLSGAFWSHVRSNAKSRGFNLGISMQDAFDLLEAQGKKCALTGEPITLAGSKAGLQTASLDRIDSNKGYEIDNIQWVHKDINRMKGCLSDEKLIYWARKLSNFKKS